MKTIPVHIITGFLGSGKTSFLNHLIKMRKTERLLVIENECGDASVDGSILMEGIENIVELSSGCLCCTLADELLEVLCEVAKKRDQYDRLIIETTGIADPSSILQVLLQEPGISDVFELQQMICLTDAQFIEDWLKEQDEALRQVALSDVILINKTDLVSGDEPEKLQSMLNEINPFAEIRSGSYGEFYDEQIFETKTTRSIQLERSPQEETRAPQGVGNSVHKITTFTIEIPHAIDLERMTFQLNQMVQLYHHQIYRIKGVIAVHDYPNRVIFQSARSAMVATDGQVWGSDDERIGYLVFIGKGLVKEAIEKRFKYL
jgi:G3E family GTPase